MTPSSGARSGTRPNRSHRGAGDGSVGKRISLACGHGVSVEQEPIAVSGGVRYFACPTCSTVEKAVRG